MAVKQTLSSFRAISTANGIICSQFGFEKRKRKKPASRHYVPGPVLGKKAWVLRGMRKGFLEDVISLQSRLFFLL